MRAQKERKLDGTPKLGEKLRIGGTIVHFGRAERLYPHWPIPTCIIVDGPYGISGFPGDPPSHRDLPDWYAPHVAAWSRYSMPQTTLWFWGTEIGWAVVHPLLDRHGWEYRSCHIWDKGLTHIAGNANSLTLRKFPVVTEVCVQYVKAARFSVNGRQLSMQEWLRYEWERSGLPLTLTNKACGVLNAATRKYFTKCHLWYYPPVDAFVRFVKYANKHGRPEGRPYFSVDGTRPLSGEEWAKMRAKFHCEVGVNNIWRESPVRGEERINGFRSSMQWKYASLHGSQKPLRLIELIVRASTDPGDAVWDPFGGLCTTAVACLRAGRRCFSAEIVPEFYLAAKERVAAYGKAVKTRTR
ncbi:MAG: DNA methyltransferase [Candidatus Methylomirabilia bacterium]